MKGKRSPILFLIIAIFFQQCANISQPTGGPKDEDPPELLSITPENGTRNFTSKEIILEFDEYLSTEFGRIKTPSDFQLANIFCINLIEGCVTICR